MICGRVGEGVDRIAKFDNAANDEVDDNVRWRSWFALDNCTWLAEGIAGIVAVDLTDDVDVLRSCLDASDFAGEVCDMTGEAVDVLLLGTGETALKLVGEEVVDISAGAFSATTVVRGANGAGFAGPRTPWPYELARMRGCGRRLSGLAETE